MALDTELNAVSKQWYDTKLYPQIYESSPFFMRMKKKNKITVGGGKQLQWPIRYRKLDRARAIGPREQIIFGGKDTRTPATLDWVYYMADTTLEWDERVKNAGPGQIIDLARDKAKELLDDMTDQLNTDFLTETTQVTNGIVPLDDIIDSSTTYAGIAVADSAEWAAVEDSSTTTMVLYGSGSLSYAFNQATFGKDHPTCYITTRDLLSKLESLLQPQVRYTSDDTLDKKFPNVMFNGGVAFGDVFLPASAFYGIDENAFELVIKSGENKVSEWFDLRQAGRPKTLAKYCPWVGNVKCNMRKTSFKFTALDYTK